MLSRIGTKKSLDSAVDMKPFGIPMQRVRVRDLERLTGSPCVPTNPDADISDDMASASLCVIPPLRIVIGSSPARCSEPFVSVEKPVLQSASVVE